MSKRVQDWLFPGAALIIFVTLLWSMLIEMNTITVSSLMSMGAGLLAYSMMLVVTFMASRPRLIEKKMGMPEMYEIHALMSVALTVMIILHIIIQWTGWNFLEKSLVSQAGWVGTIALAIVMFTGIFSISGLFVDKYPKLRQFKESLQREMMLWLHRLSIISVIAIYLHMFWLPFLRENLIFMILLNIYTIFVLGFYAYWKYKIVKSPRYKVKSIYKGTPSLWVVEFEPEEGLIQSYTAGDYFFIRFKEGADITKEGHPFSTSSAVTRRFDNTIEFMIKEVGDWTTALKNIKPGDVAQLEGPYGNFFSEELQNSPESEKPFILLGGGIGLTPNLAVARHEHNKGSQREIHLVWGLAYEEDMFMLEELEEMKAANPNFHYHIIFSNEEVDGYAHGFITNDYLAEVGADKYDTGHFFVCGPPEMLEASRRLLDKGNVRFEQISLDDFGF